MGPDAGPKCLLKIGGSSLLHRTLEDLRSAGVEEVILVVGFRKEEVVEEARRHADGLRLHVVENDRYREGAILSLWSARLFLDRPVLVMDADVLCPPSALKRLAHSPHPSCILADGSSADTGEEQMVFGEQGRVFHIAKRAPEEIRRRWTRFGESLGFLKLSRDGAVGLRKLLEEKVGAGVVNIEHEQLYPPLFGKVFVGCERVDGMSWAEIDTPEDLEKARATVLARWSSPLCFNRRLSNRFLPWILRLPLTPNQWTLTGFLLGLLGLTCWADGGTWSGFLGAVLFQLFYWADNWDGDVARARGQSSRLGSWLDLAVDALLQTALPLALASGIAALGAPPWVPAVGGLAAAGIALDFAVTLWAKLQGFGPAVFSERTQRFEGGGTGWKPWVRCNCTHENFSLLVLGIFLLDLRLPFLLALAVGSHLYWVRFLWTERHRLIQWAL